MQQQMCVRYDLGERKIYIPVYFYPPVSTGVEPEAVTPPVAVPWGEWHLCWEIDEDSMELAHFHPRGVEKVDPAMVPNASLEVVEAAKGICLAKLTNGVSTTNGIAVNLFFLPPNENGQPFVHDPTIAVTKDPLEPPPPIWPPDGDRS
jgi:hypothetical protein